jgi:hypothetical protein
MEFRFRHKATGLVVTHTDPAWASDRPNYEPIIEDYRNFEELTVPDLRALAASRGLDTSGNKPDLIKRLRG